ncbi:MAG: hypothetical protein HUU20_10520 [Pirellulales bacterium]|nr:hypothetical protein [Pirellulales bacterium]
MHRADAFDCLIVIQATPNWLELVLGRRPRVLKYCGSGTAWRNGKNGPRCNAFTSEWLHQIWNRELNRKLETRNCARAAPAY